MIGRRLLSFWPLVIEPKAPVAHSGRGGGRVVLCFFPQHGCRCRALLVLSSSVGVQLRVGRIACGPWRTPSAPDPPTGNDLPAAHGRGVVFVAPLALLAFASGLSRMWYLRAGDRTDVDALGVGLVQLKAGRAFLVRPPRQRLYPVPGVGAEEDRLPDDVVSGLAVIAQTQGIFQLFARVRTEEGCRDNRLFLAHVGEITRCPLWRTTDGVLATKGFRGRRVTSTW